MEFELALTRDDIPNPLEVLQMGLHRLVGLHATVHALRGELDALRAEISDLAHLQPHPRQSDVSTVGWGWDDLFAGRRGHAFVNAMVQQATDEPTRAFAAGALACYAGNVAGSAYLGAVVGGSRRLHRFRHRLAANSLGAWLHRHAPTPSLGALAEELRLQAREEPPVLPAHLADQLRAALAEAYPSRDPGTIDLDRAYGQMLEHLQLLASFREPSLPESPPIVLTAGGAVGAGTGDLQAFPATVDIGGGTVGVGVDEQQHPPGQASEKDPSGNACAALLLLLITFGISYLLWCIGRLTNDNKCGFEDFIAALSPDPPAPEEPTATQQDLLTLREPYKTQHILNDLFQLQMLVWQAMAAARSYLMTTGLIHPDDTMLQLSTFGQFLSLPPTDGSWPRHEMPDADMHYVRYPTSPAETPTAPPPFSDRSPDWLLHVNLVDNEQTISEVVIDALRGLNGNPINLDLDADRGRLHHCWRVAEGTSIVDSPLAVEILTYQAG